MVWSAAIAAGRGRWKKRGLLEFSGLVRHAASVPCGRGVPAEILQVMGLACFEYNGSEIIKGIADLPSLLCWLQVLIRRSPSGKNHKN